MAACVVASRILFRRFYGSNCSLFKSVRSLNRVQCCFLTLQHHVVEKDPKDCTEEPEYPPIFSTTLKDRKVQAIEKTGFNIRKLPTVQEKLLALTQEKQTRVFCLEGVDKNYNSLPFRQHATRTHFVRGLPAVHESVDVEAVYEKIKDQLKDAIILAFTGPNETFMSKLPVKEAIPKERVALRRPKPEVGKSFTWPEEQMSNIIANNAISYTTRTITAALGHDYPHLLTSSVDTESRVEAFWKCGGFHPNRNRKNIRKFWNDNFDVGLELEEPVSIPLQFRDVSTLQFRADLPLPEFVSVDHRLCQEGDVPPYNYSIETTNNRYESRWVTTLPGFWPEGDCKFGSLSFYTPEKLVRRKDRIFVDDSQEVVDGYGITTSFAWLLGIAAFNGFTIYDDLTYPLTTQTVITDGQKWSFYAYQLNALNLNKIRVAEEQPLRNVCWSTERLTLFDSIENGQIIGWNDEVMKTLLKFMLLAPAERPGVENLTPNLGERVMDDESMYRVNYAMRLYYSNRPNIKYSNDHIFMWEKIYKVWHKARPQDKPDLRFRMPWYKDPWLKELLYKRDRAKHPKNYPFEKILFKKLSQK